MEVEVEEAARDSDAPCDHESGSLVAVGDCTPLPPAPAPVSGTVAGSVVSASSMAENVSPTLGGGGPVSPGCVTMTVYGRPSLQKVIVVRPLPTPPPPPAAARFVTGETHEVAFRGGGFPVTALAGWRR